MKSRKITSLPEFKKSSNVDLAFLFAGDYHDESIHFLCYQIGTSSDYAIVKFIVLDSMEIEFDNKAEYQCFEYDEDGITWLSDFYEVSPSPFTNNRDQVHFIMFYYDQTIEIICHSYELVSIIKNFDSSTKALTSYLNDIYF